VGFGVPHFSLNFLLLIASPWKSHRLQPKNTSLQDCAKFLLLSYFAQAPFHGHQFDLGTYYELRLPPMVSASHVERAVQLAREAVELVDAGHGEVSISLARLLLFLRQKRN
jgi:hypothetical protein